MVNVTAASSNYSGECGADGDNVTWNYAYSSGVLTISGTGAIANPDRWGSMPWSTYRLDIKSVIISEGITKIGDYNFDLCTHLQSVKLPESLLSIGKCAFADCRDLAEIELPQNLTWIGTGAFNCCTSLEEISIPASVSFLGLAVFGVCLGLKTISVDENNEYYLSDETGVLYTKDKTNLITFPGGNESTTYTIPASVTNVEVGAFINSNLASIEVAPENTSYASVSGVLFNKEMTTVIQYPMGRDDASYVIPDSVTDIRDGAFYGNQHLETVTIPNGVTTIGSGAFESCYQLKEIDVPESVTTIYNGAFHHCDSLEKITINHPYCKMYGDAIVESDNWHRTTIYGYEGSTAEEYAQKHEVPFESLGKIPDRFAKEDQGNKGLGSFFQRLKDLFQRIIDFFKNLFRKKS